MAGIWQAFREETNQAMNRQAKMDTGTGQDQVSTVQTSKQAG